MKLDDYYMRIALSLAEKGRGSTSPNPLVGAVVVKDDRIVGKGYHRKPGHPHAEAIALCEAGRAAEGATLYVTLEPCIHYGRTPPCVDLILKHGIERVVIGMKDPNPNVCCRGIERLRSEGVKVEEGILGELVQEQNRGYIRYHRERRPYVTLKIATTVDGRIATIDGESRWLSSRKSLEYVHYLRATYDAVLVGINTVIKDDPLLTPRYFPSLKRPLRVVLDSKLRIDPEAKVLNEDARTLIFTSKECDPEKLKILESKGVEVERVEKKNGLLSWKGIMDSLHRRGVLYLLVEGGALISSSLIEENLVDELIIIYTPKLMGRGLSFTDGMVTSDFRRYRVKIRKERIFDTDRVFWIDVYRNS